MTETLCFLDCDGVVADLCSALAHLHGVPVETWPAGEYDLTRILRKPVDHVWAPARGATFWACLALLPWARELVDLCDARFKRQNVAFLTQPVRDPQSLAGKAEWLREHFPGRAWFIGPGKAALARPGTVLIDDADVNVAAWRDKGGAACLFPQRWNAWHESSHDPMALVRAWLEALPH